MSKDLLDSKRTMRDELITLGDLDTFRMTLLHEIKELLKFSGGSPVHQHKQWLRSSEVRKMLGVSAGTLQNLRINGTLTYTKIGGIVFYKHEDIIKTLEKNVSRW